MLSVVAPGIVAVEWMTQLVPVSDFVAALRTSERQPKFRVRLSVAERAMTEPAVVQSVTIVVQTPMSTVLT